MVQSDVPCFCILCLLTAASVCRYSDLCKPVCGQGDIRLHLFRNLHYTYGYKWQYTQNNPVSPGWTWVLLSLQRNKLLWFCIWDLWTPAPMVASLLSTNTSNTEYTPLMALRTMQSWACASISELSALRVSGCRSGVGSAWTHDITMSFKWPNTPHDCYKSTT